MSYLHHNGNIQIQNHCQMNVLVIGYYKIEMSNHN